MLAAALGGKVFRAREPEIGWHRTDSALPGSAARTRELIERFVCDVAHCEVCHILSVMSLLMLKSLLVLSGVTCDS